MSTNAAPASSFPNYVARQQNQPLLFSRGNDGVVHVQPTRLARLPQAHVQNSTPPQVVTDTYRGLLDGTIELRTIPPRRPVPAPALAPAMVVPLPVNHSSVSEPRTPPERDLEANTPGCCGVVGEFLSGVETSTLWITGSVVGAVGIIAIVAVAKLTQVDGPETGKLIGIGAAVLVGVGGVAGICLYRGRNRGSLSPERRYEIGIEGAGFAMNNR